MKEAQNNLTIKLYGSNRCHKTQFYIKFLDETRLPYEFLDVEINKDYAEELRGLYTNRKLNFPTITIGSKKLRNPQTKELEKWLIPNH
ncbi:MAG: arsenate reductase-like glutaredoxin family protein [Glaciecola sp.]